MAQVTIYLDDTVAEAMRAAVKAQNMSQSRWISHLIQQALQSEWPPEVAELAGVWSDFPDLSEIRSEMGEDAVRERL
jgi:hypothetical protein